MDAAALDRLLERLGSGRPLFLMHLNADADCVGSAFALQAAFGGVVGASDGLSKEGTRLADRLGLKVDPWPHPEQFDVVVAVDTSSRSQLARLGPLVGDPCLVDHHDYGDLLAASPAFAWDAARPSCAEVVVAVLDAAKRPLDKESAFALAAAILSDTARFRHADAEALRTTARLLDICGTTLGEIERLLASDDEEGEDDPSRRIAMLTAAQRVRFHKHGGLILATSEVRAFDAAAAGALVRAGADVAVVVSERASAARMSLRASHRALEHGVHLGELANRAARETGWSGGGHDAAAGLSGQPPAAPALERLTQLLRERMEDA